MTVTSTRSLLIPLGLVLMFFGFVVCVMGFGHAVNSGWGTFDAIHGFSELLFGLSFEVLGVGLIIIAKR